MADVLASGWYRDLSTPRLATGDVAADFELPLLDGSGAVRLSGLQGRAVALVFGSYT
jgi:peroxiredoxin